MTTLPLVVEKFPMDEKELRQELRQLLPPTTHEPAEWGQYLKPEEPEEKVLLGSIDGETPHLWWEKVLSLPFTQGTG